MYSLAKNMLLVSGAATAARMRPTIILVLVLVIAAFLGSVDAHVMGIDFGSEFIKVAAPHRDQSVDIVLNELSKRKTDNFLGFRNGERYIGDQAKTLAARFPLLTVTAVNQLMGIQKDSAEATAFSNMKYEYELQFDKRNTAIVPVKDSHGPFTAEELYAMFLTYSEQISLKDGVTSPQSAVVTIPFHASVAERRAILEAARLANIDILGFLHSTTATALYYGIRHRGFEKRNVTLVVFDIGTTHTEAGVYRFTPRSTTRGGSLGDAFGTLTTVAVLEDKTLGGRALDLCVADLMEKDAVATMGIKPVIGGRTAAQLKSQFSLLRAANKAREILSANTKTPFTVEGIATDRDFHSMITREAYEAHCSPLFARVKQLAKEVLDTTGLKPSQIDAFEMMGGAARTPKIISDLSAVLGREVDRTMNMDEAAAIGAAYYAVKLSLHYRVKSFKLNEQVPVTISFTIDPPAKKQTNSGTPLRRVLFTSTDKIGTSMSVSVNRTTDFTMRLFDSPVTHAHFAEMKVTGVHSALEQMNFSKPTIPHPNNTHFVRLQVRVNETGLFEPEDAEVIVRYAVNVSSTVDVNETLANGTTVRVPKKVYTTRMRQNSRKVKTTVSWFNPRERTDRETLDSETKLFDIMESERAKREIAEAKNNFEGYLFWVKGDGVFYNDDLVAQIEPAKMDTLRSAVTKAEEWLEDGPGSTESCTRSEFEEQHRLLKKLVNETTGQRDETAPMSDNQNMTAADEGSNASESVQSEEDVDTEGSQDNDDGGSHAHDGVASEDEDPEDL